MKLHCSTSLLAVFFLLVSISAFPQCEKYSDSCLIQVGPFGRPLQVRDEFSNWKIPISVYRDSEVEIFIPDITNAGWSAWNIEKFRQTGEYEVTLYSHFKSSAFCRREIIPAGRKNDSNMIRACAALRYQSRLLSVNTRNNAVTVLHSILMGADGRGDIRSASFPKKPLSNAASTQPTLKAIGTVSSIVKRQSRNFTGITVQQTIQNNNKVVLKMMHDTMSPDATEGKNICDAPGINWIGPKPDYCQQPTNEPNKATQASQMPHYSQSSNVTVLGFKAEESSEDTELHAAALGLTKIGDCESLTDDRVTSSESVACKFTGTDDKFLKAVFSSDKLQSFEFNFPLSQYDAVLEKIEKSFGKPRTMDPSSPEYDDVKTWGGVTKAYLISLGTTYDNTNDWVSVMFHLMK